jgi:mono/diheme cytochrome c family protein
LLLSGAGLIVQAQDKDLSGLKPEYKPLMQAVAQAYDAMEDAIEDQHADAAKQNAEKLSEHVSKIIEFWASHNVADAQEFATNLKKAADDVAAKAAASDFAGAEAAEEQAEQNCSSCHEAHRKFGLGGWKIK